MSETSLVPRWPRARATLRDALELLAALSVAGVIAMAWLLLRTGAGRDDVSEFDAILAAAVVLAVPPAWFVRFALATADGGTAGQRAAGLEVEGARRQRTLRVALHPLSLPAWWWLAALAAAAGAQLGAVALALTGGAVALGAAASLLRWAGGRAGLHDVAAGTRIQVRKRGPS